LTILPASLHRLQKNKCSDNISAFLFTIENSPVYIQTKSALRNLIAAPVNDKAPPTISLSFFSHLFSIPYISSFLSVLHTNKIDK